MRRGLTLRLASLPGGQLDAAMLGNGTLLWRMTCPTEDVVAAFVEGQLSPAETQSIVEHIDRCVDCRTLVAGAASDPVEMTNRFPAALDTMADGAAEGQSADGAGAPRLRGYRILERIGQGAMGEVYRAEDEQLARPVAIKLLSLASTPAARQRFLNEARTVARLRHPNIVTIYSSDISGERPFIVSELLSGVSLDRLALPLPGAEVLRIGAALASGLAAAHRQGILHRDIKPANAMQTEEGEVKLLDFGLAKLIDAAPAPSGQALASALPAGAAVTHTGALVGTPLYMAPELWRGGPATAATDVYSFGALLYELALGRAAHSAMSLDGLRRAATTSAPEPLRRAAPGLSPALAAIIERCLAMDPALRFPSAVELSEELEKVRAARPASRWTRPRVAAAVASVAVIAGVAAVLAREGTPPSPASSAPLLVAPAAAGRTARRSVVVVPLVDAAPEPETAWISTALAELLSASFAVGEALRVVPGDDVARMWVDLELQGGGSLDGDALRRIRRHASVDVIVTGSFERTGKDGLRVRAQMVEAATGAVLATAEATGTQSAFRDVALSIGERLLPALGQLPPSEAQAAQVRATLPESLVAARLYSEGIERYRAFDFEATRDRFERAARESPDSPAPHDHLASLWLSLGRDEDARREAKLALDRANVLPREHQLRIKALWYRVQPSKRSAVETLWMLHELFPDHLEYGLSLAAEQPRAEGLATLAQLRKLPPPAGEDPAIDIAEYNISEAVPEGLAAARRAAAKGRARGARLIFGQARCLEGWALLDQGDLDLAQAALEEATPILEARGDVFGATEAMRALGAIALVRDDMDAAQRHLERAESLLAGIGNEASYIYALRNVAGVYRQRGDMVAARRKLEEALRVSERASNKDRLAQTYWVLAVLEHIAGNMPAARAAFDRALAIAKELDDSWLARIFQGDLGRFLIATGELDGARAALSWAISGKDSEGRRRSAAPNRRDLALLELEEGHLADAAARASEALDEVEREKATAEIALAAGVKAQVLAAQGDLAGAVALADGAVARMARSDNQLVRIRATLAWAHVHARRADPARLGSVEAALSEVAAAAQRAGFGELTEEARFAECELLSARKASARARACFAAFETSARAKGFVLLANRARAQAR
jgi:tetratricopeptide (TPR) repeat protein/TolB-like protein